MTTPEQQELNLMKPTVDNALLWLNGWTHLHWAAAVDAVETAQVLFSFRAKAHCISSIRSQK